MDWSIFRSYLVHNWSKSTKMYHLAKHWEVAKLMESTAYSKAKNRRLIKNLMELQESSTRMVISTKEWFQEVKETAGVVWSPKIQFRLVSGKVVTSRLSKRPSTGPRSKWEISQSSKELKMKMQLGLMVPCWLMKNFSLSALMIHKSFRKIDISKMSSKSLIMSCSRQRIQRRSQREWFTLSESNTWRSNISNTCSIWQRTSFQSYQSKSK